jgi:hypothetical protein
VATKDVILFDHLELGKVIDWENVKIIRNKSDPTIMVALNALNHTDFMSKNYILNGLDNTLYNMYSSIKSIKALWEALDKK